jgi:hypothetical protein
VKSEGGKLATLKAEQYRHFQGTTIAEALLAHGYVANHLGNLQWEITRLSDDFFVVMVFLPRPIEQWRLLPVQADNPHHAEIYRIIAETIGGRR